MARNQGISVLEVAVNGIRFGGRGAILANPQKRWGYRSLSPNCLSPNCCRRIADFVAFAETGRELARIHVEYEALDPWPLEWVESPSVPLSYAVKDKMRLSKDKTSLAVNDTLTLRGIPPETFDYRLGNRSALEWVIDQYRVTEDDRSGIRSDPNRPEDPEYIVRLVGQVVRVSIETVRLVHSLPKEFAP
jgi:predicted helicase